LIPLVWFLSATIPEENWIVCSPVYISYANNRKGILIISRLRIMPIGSFPIPSTAQSFDTSMDAKVLVNPVPDKPVISHEGDYLYSSSKYGNQWYNENGIMPAEIDSDYNFKTIGTYHVVVTLFGCSSLPSDNIEIVKLGIPAITTGAQLLIYPNPSHGEFTITLKGIKEGRAFLKILNYSGQIVWEKEYLCLDSKPVCDIEPGILPDGFYFLIVRTGDTSTTGKFAIVH
jgi:hypothetical protein